MLFRYVFCLSIFLLVACKNGGTANLEAAKTTYEVQPLPSLPFTNDDTVNVTKAVGSLGENRGDFGFDETDANLRGHFTYNASTYTLSFKRSAASGSAWADWNFIPNDGQSLLRHKLKDMKSVSVIIKAQINADQPSLGTGCGIIFGFGSGTGHPNAASLGASLRLADRDWSASPNANQTPRDYFRILYEAAMSNQKLTVDAPVNSFNMPNAWDRFTAAQWRESASEFAVMRTTSLTTAGDWLTYKQTMQFDMKAGTVTVTIQPLTSNVDMSQWQSQTVTWDISQPVTATSASGSARGGLDLTNATGATAMTLSELGEQYVTVGFTGNLAPRVCEFTQLNIEKPL
jgi:hypothetical protein